MIKYLAILVLSFCGCATTRPPTQSWMVLDTKDIRVRTNFAKQMQGWHDALASNVLRCGSARRVQRIEVTILWPSDFEAIRPTEHRSPAALRFLETAFSARTSMLHLRLQHAQRADGTTCAIRIDAWS